MVGFAMSLVCGVLVIGVIALGIIAMIDKPASSESKPKKSAAVLAVPTRPQRLVA